MLELRNSIAKTADEIRRCPGFGLEEVHFVLAFSEDVWWYSVVVQLDVEESVSKS
jgi:hypothetical protein